MLNIQDETILVLQDPGHRLKRHYLRSFLPALKDQSILEIGCGYGDLAMEILQEESPFHYVIVDVSRTYLLHTKKTMLANDPRVSYIQADAQVLPLACGLFDAIICSEVIEHLPDDLKAASECYRVLKPGGTLVLSTPHGGELEAHLGHLRLYNRDSFLALIRSSCFVPEKVMYCTRLSKWIWIYPKRVFIFLWSVLRKLRLSRTFYHDSTFHKAFVRPIMDQLLSFDCCFSGSAYSILGRRATILARLKKQ